jgi:hypothetical protein
MALIEIVNNHYTDKNTRHSYIPLYDKLLSTRKQTAKNVLEIGIYQGGSIDLWAKYFPNATVHAVDIMHMNQIPFFLKNRDNIKLYTETDAYSDTFIQKLIDTGIKFDFILDDGPHTLESQQKYLKNYTDLLSDKGILILEDIQSIDYVNELISSIPENLRCFCKLYDLRPIKNCYDDIVISIDKSIIP